GRCSTETIVYNDSSTACSLSSFWQKTRRNSMMIMAQVVQRNWWMVALRGVLAIIFGLIALFLPGIALLAFIAVFAAYALIDGIVAVIVAIRERGSLNRWGWVLAEGVL